MARAASARIAARFRLPQTGHSSWITRLPLSESSNREVAPFTLLAPGRAGWRETPRVAQQVKGERESRICARLAEVLVPRRKDARPPFKGGRASGAHVEVGLAQELGDLAEVVRAALGGDEPVAAVFVGDYADDGDGSFEA